MIAGRNTHQRPDDQKEGSAYQRPARHAIQEIQGQRYKQHQVVRGDKDKSDPVDVAKSGGGRFHFMHVVLQLVVLCLFGGLKVRQNTVFRKNGAARHGGIGKKTPVLHIVRSQTQ